MLHFGKFPSGGGLARKSTISFTLIIVPAIIPITPKTNRNVFLAIFSFPETPLKSFQKTMVCITEGAISANAEDATAPMSEMKRSIFGMAAANATTSKYYPICMYLKINEFLPQFFCFIFISRNIQSSYLQVNNTKLYRTTSSTITERLSGNLFCTPGRKISTAGYI